MTPSCSSSNDTPTNPSADADYGFTLYLSLSDNNAITRSTPTDGDYDGQSGYSSGVLYENYIDLGAQDYRIYLFNSNNKLIYAVPESDMSLLPTTSSSVGAKTYELRFRMTAKQVKDAGLNPENCVFKLLMLANWREYPSVDNGVSIETLLSSDRALRPYSAPLAATLTADDRIPLFGINQFGVIKLDPEWRTQLGTIHLLRAYSKIEVYDSEETCTPIHKVALTRYNTKSYCAPMLKEWMQSEYVTNSYKSDYGATFRNPDSEVSTDLPLKKDPESGHFFIYVPEFRNIDAVQDSKLLPRNDEERTRLKVIYLDEISREEHCYMVDFKYYDALNAQRNGAQRGDYFNLNRNYWYRYVLNRGKVDLLMQVDVIPYHEIILEPEFGFDNPLPRPPSEWVTPPWVELDPEN